MDFLNAIPMETDQLFELALWWGGTLLSALAVLVFGMWVAKRLTRWVTSLLQRKSMDEAAAGFVGQIAYAILVVMVLLTALDQVGVDTTSMIAALGAAGLAIGLALQSSLSNLASGFLLVTLRPFKKGDYIEAAGTSGSVDQITMLQTRLVTPDNRKVTVPNSSVMSQTITNYSALPTRRLDLVVGVSYDDDIRQVKAVLEELVNSDERIMKEPSYLIAVAELADSSVNFNFRMWCQASDYWALKWDMTERIKLTFDERGISIPYPQRDVHIHQPGRAAE
ncbi:mechanosensitive ion channel [Cobetia marina]|uniref:Small-conductance mechanosensitive channel n=1 Tax=Cobetia marina TaxID=28258 RepID=A0ABU9GD47_COBMA|nr:MULTISPECIES: mechanosensitive ion channel domain-containing protein [Cobetia]MDA5562221.1 mechanosensitive ion channel [Cobetia sp. MMG027]MDH2375131.1 mechanosensitive ion channel [Cobetia sp. 3AK]MDI6002163.1 mechanosensitive ion channel [Cobetia pacifica]MDN2655278.1 mechanosensitive ion channel [Cobetia sp. 14N.309.X.WAT.E.A4]MDO6788043.1 mechanosensitive ion channel [Cobetia marina]